MLETYKGKKKTYVQNQCVLLTYRYVTYCWESGRTHVKTAVVRNMNRGRCLHSFHLKIASTLVHEAFKDKNILNMRKGNA